MLVGRGSERARIDALLDDARSGAGGALLVLGEPGIGKTALLDYAVERAEGFTCLRALGTETESELAFAALDELLRPALGAIEQLSEQQESALRAALALGPSGEVDRFGVYTATVALLVELADAKPLLCVVDDAQWIDQPSAEAVLFSARRLANERVALLVAAREDEAPLFESRLPELRLGGLHREAAQALLGQSGLELENDVAEQLLETSGGNALALLELPRALTPAQRQGAEPLVGPAPVGRRVEHAFLGRVRRLSPAAQRALLVAAALESGDGETVARALDALGLDASSLHDAESAALVVLRDGAYRFVHPLVRSAVYMDADPVQRRRVHRAVADALRDRDGRYAWHLAAAADGPDEDVAAALEAAAREAGKRGGTSAESAGHEYAARMSPDPEFRARRLLAAASVASSGGGLARVERLCREALAQTVDPVMRGEIHKELENVLFWAGRLADAHRIKLEVADELEAIAPVQSAHMRARATASLTHMLRGDEAVRIGREAFELLTRSGGEDLRVPTMLAQALIKKGEIEEGGRLAAAAAASVEGDQPTGLTWNVADILMLLDEHVRAEALAARDVHGDRAQGAFSSLALSLEQLARVQHERGDLYRAYAAATESVELAAQLEDELLQVAYSHARVTIVLAALGRLDEARASAERAFETARACGSLFLEATARAALGRAALAAGALDAAVEELERVARAVRGGGYRNPAFVQFSPELVEAYVRLRRHEDAMRELALLEADTELIGTPWARAVAARSRGLVADGDGFRDHFEEALTHHDASPRLLERAHTELVYGERLRRAGNREAARERLRAAHEAFDAGGAAAYRDRAREELRASGETIRKDPSARDELTPQELQVALVVADGASNKEAAAQLFLSPKTIEYHLRNAYRKLGVTSRTQLAKTLQAADLD